MRVIGDDLNQKYKHEKYQKDKSLVFRLRNYFLLHTHKFKYKIDSLIS